MDLNNLIWQIQDFVIVFLIFFTGLYIYLAIAVRDSAKKLGISKEWASISWLGYTIPYVMANSAKKPWWPTLVFILIVPFLSILNAFYNISNSILLLFIILFFGYMIYLKWEICELRDIYGWWALVTPVLVVLAIILGAISENLEIVSLILAILGFIWYFVLWGILAWSK